MNLTDPLNSGKKTRSRRPRTPAAFSGWLRKIFLILGLLPSAIATSNAAELLRPGAADEPTEVGVAVGILDLTAVNDTTQSFSGNIFVRLTWRDTRLAHTEKNAVTRPLDEVWNPRLGIVNTVSITETLPKIVEVSPDGVVTYRQRMIGTFSQPLHLGDFPFDHQKFTLRIVSVGNGPDDVNLVPLPEQSVVDAAHWALSNWTLTDWRLENQSLDFGGQIPPVAGFIMEMGMNRNTGYFVFKMILPLVLIVAMSWIVFWISPELAAIQVSVSVTSMLTLIAYRFMVDALVPRVSYLTRLDLFILGATLLVFFTLIQAVGTAKLAKQGRLPLAERLDRGCRVIVPVIFVGWFFWSLVV